MRVLIVSVLVGAAVGFASLTASSRSVDQLAEFAAADCADLPTPPEVVGCLLDGSSAGSTLRTSSSPSELERQIDARSLAELAVLKSRWDLRNLRALAHEADEELFCSDLAREANLPRANGDAETVQMAAVVIARCERFPDAVKKARKVIAGMRGASVGYAVERGLSSGPKMTPTCAFCVGPLSGVRAYQRMRSDL